MDRPLTPPSESSPGGPHLDEDRILDLLLDLLPAVELAAAGRHLSSCKHCEDLLRRRGAFLERRRASTGIATALASATDPERSADPHRSQRGAGIQWLTGVFRRPAYAVGLGLALLGAVVLLLTAHPRRSATYPTVAEWLPSAHETLSLRDGADQAQAEGLAAGLEAYDRRDLPAAIRALSNSKTTGTRETMRLVYLGSSLAQAGEYGRAVQILRSCPLARIPQPWRGESSWNLLIALHATGDNAAADSMLRLLATEKSALGGRARRLLGRSGP